MVKIDNIIDDFIMIDNPKNIKNGNGSFKLQDNKLYSYNEIIGEKNNNDFKIYLKKAPFNFDSITTSKHVSKLLNKCSSLKQLEYNDNYVILQKLV
jgi:hypothetical protein